MHGRSTWTGNEMDEVHFYLFLSNMCTDYGAPRGYESWYIYMHIYIYDVQDVYLDTHCCRCTFIVTTIRCIIHICIVLIYNVMPENGLGRRKSLFFQGKKWVGEELEQLICPENIYTLYKYLWHVYVRHIFIISIQRYVRFDNFNSLLIRLFLRIPKGQESPFGDFPEDYARRQSGRAAEQLVESKGRCLSCNQCQKSAAFEMKPTKRYLSLRSKTFKKTWPG